jgi:NAD(P)-dependent dehydrogenase (short-subunit alcohol dehydrogenase family)
MKLNTSTAIVTGVTRGLGAAIAEALVKKGASVYGLSRSI